MTVQNRYLSLTQEAVAIVSDVMHINHYIKRNLVLTFESTMSYIRIVNVDKGIQKGC